ncbi:MAG TPA: hypothetical protein VD970_18165 [Acetobacteraceae bacterium]|nr:hypothetical protein [Acetobacteraceae bacterium]
MAYLDELRTRLAEGWKTRIADPARTLGAITLTLDPDQPSSIKRNNAVHFSLDGFVVSSDRLKGVAAAFRDGTITMRFGLSSGAFEPPTATASGR